MAEEDSPPPAQPDPPPSEPETAPPPIPDFDWNYDRRGNEDDREYKVAPPPTPR